MKTPLLVCTAALLALPLQAAVVEGDIVGVTEIEIRSALLNEGYEVKHIELDGDEIEVEVLLDGTALELELSAKTGAVIEIELGEGDS
jgi:uncharacterized membrane protein YkoI